MKDKTNQLFRDKFILVMLVLSLLAIVAAVGTVTVRKGNSNRDESPYLEMNEPEGLLIGEGEEGHVAGDSNAANAADQIAGQIADQNSGQNAVSAADHAQAADANIHAAAGTHTKEQAAKLAEEEHTSALEAGAAVGDSLVLDYNGTDRLLWPVYGNVVLSYSMDTTTYFPTLEQYKCNPANVIQSEVSTPVAAPANARVMEIGTNEEIGNYVRLDLGNEYTAVCGQLKEIPVVENEYLEKGAIIGYIAEPTKYYSVEGVNLYFELLHEGKPVDSLDYLE